MTSTRPVEDDHALFGGGARVSRIPALVKGQIVLPPAIDFGRLVTATAAAQPVEPGADGEPRWYRTDDAWVLRRWAVDRETLLPTGEPRFLLFPVVDPWSLVEDDIDTLVRELYNLPFAEVLDYVGALRGLLVSSGRNLLGQVADYVQATSPLDDQLFETVLAAVPALLDPDGIRQAVDQELGDPDVPGSRYLDEWVDVGRTAHRGSTAWLSDVIFGAAGSSAPPARMRAMPTRQLHITAGNSHFVPFVSTLRAIATKSAAVVKSPGDSSASSALLAVAMHHLDAAHPITRHLSLVYWKGGDRATEQVLLRPGSFDRLVVWGTADTLESVAARAETAKTIALKPRVGISMVAPGVDEDLDDIAVRTITDSMVGNQAACTSSLVHYVEGTERTALAYCAAVQRVLAAWDAAYPHTPPREALGRLRRLRRGEWVNGRWFANGEWPDISSAVVYLPAEFDLASHPGSRCVIVRRVDDLADAARYAHPGISTVTVHPEHRRVEIRDVLAAQGVGHVLPIGEGERTFAAMPHDGMRLMSELVHWISG